MHIRSICRPAIAPVLVMLLYLGGAIVGLALTRSTGGIATLWPPNALLLAVLLASPRPCAARFFLAGAIGSLFANLWGGNTFWGSAGFTAVNMAEVLLAYALVRRGSAGSIDFTNFEHVGRFGLIAVVASAFGGALAGLVAPGSAAQALGVASAWFMAGVLGTLIITPLSMIAIALLRGETALRSGRGVVETIGVLAFLAVMTASVFEQAEYPLLFLPLACLLLTTHRLGVFGAAAGVVIVAVIGAVFTGLGRGPVALIDQGFAARILFLQFYLVIIFAASLPLAASLASRRDLAARLSISERRHRMIVERSRAVIFETDAAGRWTYLNPAWAELMGCPVEATLGTSFMSAVHSEDRGRALDNLAQLYAGAIDSCRQELRYCRQDGTVRWASVESNLIRDEAGKITGSFGTLHDVSDRVEAEQALAESEHGYRLLAENSNDMIVVLTLEGSRSYVSPACRALLGFEPHELIGGNPAAAIHPEDRARAIDVCRGLLSDAGGEPMCSYRQRRKDGSYAWLEATYKLIRNASSGEPEGVIASVRDISRRRAAELEAMQAAAQLREGHRLLLMAETAAQIGHWRLDVTGETLFWSDEVYRIYGLPSGSAIALEEAVSGYHPEDREMVSALVERAIAGLEPFEFRARIRRPDGSIRHVLSRGQAETAPDGSVVGLFGVFQDITEQHIAEVELVAARDAARAAADAKSAFLATMSHEIRTPLTGVIGMIELLRLDPSAAQRERFFKSLDQSAQMLMTVINDVLDFSKIESEKLVLEAIDFDLGALAQTTVDLFHNAASQEGLLLALAVPEDELIVQGDPVRVQQIVANLLGNAIKFTTEGRIDLGVSAGLNDDGGEAVLITVRDTGIGIDAAVLPGLFSPFVQADASTTRRFGGTGLGLAICHKLVAAMGGSIAVQSTPGSGTDFIVTLPMRRGERLAGDSVVPRVAVGPQRPLSVLVAEDNAVNQLLITGLLRHAGHRVTCVANGLLAVESARAQLFDAVLMDMQMPELDGLEATRMIRALPGAAGLVPVIALTADATAERRPLYHDAGLSGFLTKPVNSARLAHELARLTMIGRQVEPPPALLSAFDPERLTAIVRIFGRPQRDMLLGLLRADAVQRAAAIDGLIGSGSLDELRRSAHALAGAAANVGATRLAQVARRLETAADIDSAASAAIELKRAGEDAVAEIDRLCVAKDREAA